jgi:hypothetical protein
MTKKNSFSLLDIGQLISLHHSLRAFGWATSPPTPVPRRRPEASARTTRYRRASFPDAWAARRSGQTLLQAIGRSTRLSENRAMFR